jgi:transcriptional regulator with XRE-family HTH domain
MAREQQQQMPVIVDVSVKKRRRSLGPRATEMDAIVGKRLRTARKLANITQQELAEVLGVSFQAVQKYESGENRITAPKLFKAADFLGADIRFFTTADFDGVAQRDHTSLADEEIELLRVYRAVASPRARLLLRKLLDELGGRAAAPDHRADEEDSDT